MPSFRFGRRRRGVTTVQWVLLAAVTTIVVIVSVKELGVQSNTRLEGTSGAVGDPANIKNLVDPQ